MSPRRAGAPAAPTRTGWPPARRPGRRRAGPGALRSPRYRAPRRELLRQDRARAERGVRDRQALRHREGRAQSTTVRTGEVSRGARSSWLRSSQWSTRVGGCHRRASRGTVTWAGRGRCTTPQPCATAAPQVRTGPRRRRAPAGRRGVPAGGRVPAAPAASTVPARRAVRSEPARLTTCVSRRCEARPPMAARTVAASVSTAPASPGAGPSAAVVHRATATDAAASQAL